MSEDAVELFIDRWSSADGSERANYQLFLTELCTLLDLPQPEPASEAASENAYAFERRVTFNQPDGSQDYGFIDLYRRGSFVCEAKKTGKVLGSQAWDAAMIRAHAQAQRYARALPAAEGRPPFLLVLDVGRALEIYSEFSRSGGAYVPYPDPRSHVVRLEELAGKHVRDRLRKIWLDPLSLDPSLESARVTKGIARDLAKLAESLEKQGYDAESVAAFLMRCLFTMFAEDVGLLPGRSFADLLQESLEKPELFQHLVPGLWKAMNEGGFSAQIRTKVLQFNGGLFAEQRVLPLDKKQLALLRMAAEQDWSAVEPAIFGTLLERALDPDERHKLGAHYTPRAYVERLVMPTVIEPLRSDWEDVRGAAFTLDQQGKRKEAVEQLRAFHRELCKLRVLDPACGSGNFLYVTLEHLKRLEGEIFNALDELGDTQERLEETGVTVDPHQMLGLELNPRAARIAEAVLWIGYLQWHYRTRGAVDPPEPVLKDFHNIEKQDAVLAWDKIEYVLDEDGRPVTRWDGKTTKTHPVTGELVPDESAQVPVERYVNPRKAEWPEADFVIGNPPFIGNKRMRGSLGSGYVDALRSVYPNIPSSADYVMYWWHTAASLTRSDRIRRFGLITTSSIVQEFNRRVVEHHLDGNYVSLVYAVPNHPWVDGSEGADVRIALTVGKRGNSTGILASETAGVSTPGETSIVPLHSREGKITADLRVGADVTSTLQLAANQGISNRGVLPHGKGFLISQEQAQALGLGRVPGLEAHIRLFRNGRDLTQVARNLMVIDLFGLDATDVRRRFPDVYQWILERVKPERDQNPRASRRLNWWIFGEPNPTLRHRIEALHRYIATPQTSRHRVLVFLSSSVLPDDKIVAITVDSSDVFGILSSRIHARWALASGGWLGVGNDPVYNKTNCLDTFPFPVLTEAQKTRIGDLAEQIDVRRKKRQKLHPKLKLTDVYNVLEKLRSGQELTDKDKKVHEQGLVTVLAELHDELDAAVLDAYGWSDLAPALVGKPGGLTPSNLKSPEQEQAEERLLERLVALNAERAAEEARGIVRWLRPEFQNPHGQSAGQDSLLPEAAPAAVAASGKRAWPKSLAEQFRAVREVLAEQPAPVAPAELARGFKRAQTKRVSELLRTLDSLGQARETDGLYSA